MSKPPKKWTKWLPWANHPRPLIATEVLKIKLIGGDVVKATVEKILSVGYDDFGHITHYKRLRANVEVEQAPWMEAAILAGHDIVDASHDTTQPECPYDDYTREALLDKIGGLESDLENAVETAYYNGAEGWTELNYPEIHRRLLNPCSAPSRVSKLSGKFDAAPPEPAPEMWVQVAEHPDGWRVCSSPYPTESEAAEVDCLFDSIGTFKLTKGEG